MNVAAAAAGVAENVAGGGTGAFETSIAGERLAPSVSFGSHWQAVWAGVNAKTGNGLIAKSKEAGESGKTELQRAQSDESRTAAGMDRQMDRQVDRQEVAVTAVSPGNAGKGALAGVGNLRANDLRPAFPVAGLQRGPFGQISESALKAQSPAGGDSTPAARPATREDKCTSHAAKDSGHAAMFANTELQPLTGGTALVVPTAQQVMSPVTAQMPLLTQQFPTNVSATSPHDSVPGTVSGSHERTLHGTDALQAGNYAAKAAVTGSEKPTLAVAPQSSARVVTGGGTTIDAGATVESEQPAHVSDEMLETTPAREHALRAGGQDSSLTAVQPTSGQADASAMTEIRDAASANRAVDASQAAGQAVSMDNAGHFAADGNSAISLPAGAAKSSTEKISHVASETGADAQIPHISAAQSSGVEAPASMHVAVRGQGTAGAISGHDGETTTAGAVAGDPFAALDSGSGVGRPSWVHTGGQRAEAGFEDPALGWVSVRADLNGGAVHAVLVPGSAEAAQTLSAHLPGLSTYLSEQHTPVATLTMATTDGGSAGTSQSMQQNADQNTGQNGSAGAQAGVGADPAANSPRESPDRAAQSGETNPAFLTGGLNGTHISVMA
jgi:hypothetical protein